MECGIHCNRSKRDWDVGIVHRLQAVVVNDPKVLVNAFAGQVGSSTNLSGNPTYQALLLKCYVRLRIFTEKSDSSYTLLRARSSICKANFVTNRATRNNPRTIVKTPTGYIDPKRPLLSS